MADVEQPRDGGDSKMKRTGRTEPSLTVVTKSTAGQVEMVPQAGRPPRYLARRKSGESAGTYSTVASAQQALRTPKNPEMFPSGYLSPDVEWK